MTELVGAVQAKNIEGFEKVLRQHKASILGVLLHFHFFFFFISWIFLSFYPYLVFIFLSLPSLNLFLSSQTLVYFILIPLIFLFFYWFSLILIKGDTKVRGTPSTHKSGKTA